jgi:hypothetical protein
MRTTGRCVLLLSLLVFGRMTFGQEKFNDVRQFLADSLTGVKTAARAADLAAARKDLKAALEAWENDVKPMIVEGVRTNSQFQEYFDRMGDVDTNLAALAVELEEGDSQKIETRVNATIWAISHHPRGFSVPPPRYTIWDWVFGLGIGLGFCVFAIIFGLHLRRSYYRRYARPEAKVRKG